MIALNMEQPCFAEAEDNYSSKSGKLPPEQFLSVGVLLGAIETLVQLKSQDQFQTGQTNQPHVICKLLLFELLPVWSTLVKKFVNC